MMKNNRKLLIGAILLSGFVPLYVSAAFSPNEWMWKKTIALPTEVFESGAYVKINLDQESSVYSAPGLSDLRVIRDGVTEVPFQLVTESISESKAFLPATIVDRTNDNGDTILIIDVGDSPVSRMHNAVEITASNANYRRQVSIYSSDVRLNWSDPKWGWINPTSRMGALTRSTDAFIYRFTDSELGFNAGSGMVYYPETSSRYLRVVIHKENEKKVLLDISGARVYREVLPTAIEDEVQVPVSVVQNAKERSTEITADLLGGGLPTKAFILNAQDNSNFNRRATIAGSNDGNNWNLIGQGYLFQVKTPFFDGKELSMRYGEISYRYLRVVVFNDDNEPIPFGDKVILKSVLRSIVFEAPKVGVYALYYGNKSANTPRYDLARYFQYVESITVPRASLGIQELNSSYVSPAPPVVPFTDRNKNAINGALVILVAIVSFLLISHLKKLKLGKPNS